MTEMCGLIIIKENDGIVHAQISKYNMPVEIIAMQLRAVLKDLDNRYNHRAKTNITNVNPF